MKKIYSEPNLYFIKEKYKTENLDRVIELFNEKFKMNKSKDAIKDVIKRNKFRKLKKKKKEILCKKMRRKPGRPSMYTTRILNKMRALAEQGLISRQAKNIIELKVERDISLNSFRIKAKQHKIYYNRTSAFKEDFDFSEKIINILLRNAGKKSYIIRDAIIEKQGIHISSAKIGEFYKSGFFKMRYLKFKKEKNI